MHMDIPVFCTWARCLALKMAARHRAPTFGDMALSRLPHHENPASISGRKKLEGKRYHSWLPWLNDKVFVTFH